MATLSATNASTLNTQMTASAAGDVIECAAGNYGDFSRTTSTTKASPFVSIVPADRNSPPVFKSITMTNVSGFIWDGIRVNQTATTTATVTISGTTYSYPGTGSGRQMNLNTCNNLTFKNSTFSGSKDGILVWNCDNFTFSRNLSYGTYCDFMDLYINPDGILIEYNIFRDAIIIPNLTKRSDWHPDSNQFAVPTSSTPASGANGAIIRYNIYSLSPNYCQGPFILNEKLGGAANPSNWASLCHKNVEIYGNDIQASTWNGGIFLQQISNVTCTGNRIRKYPGSTEANPRITISGKLTGTISNNVFPLGILGDTTQTGLTVSDNVTSTTADPTGWVDRDDSNTGPYSEDELPAPSTPAQLQAADWSIGEVVADAGFPGRYTAVVYIPPTSVAWNNTGILNGFRWSQGVVDVSAGNSTTQGASNLTKLANGTIRYQLISASGNGHTIASGETFSNLRVYWRSQVGGPLSPASADGKSFTITVAVPPQVTAAALNKTAYTTAETMTVNVTGSTTGSGTSLQFTYVWKDNGVTFATVGPTATASNSQSASGRTGPITVQITPSTTAGSGNAFTTASATVSPPITPVAPDVTNVVLNNSAYTVGATATATPTYTAGNGTGVTVAYQWMLNGGNVGTNSSSYLTTGTGTLTCRVTVTSSNGSDSFTSAASSVTAAPVAPDVTAVTLNSAAYTVGQTATMTPTYTAGNGTGLVLTYKWFLGGVEIVGATSVSYVTENTGSLTGRTIATTSAGTDNFTSAASTVTAAPVAPDVTAVTLDNSAYVVGDTATATITYSPGNGTSVTPSYQWKLDGSNVGTDSATYLTTAPGSLTCVGTVTSTAGSDNATSAASTVSAALVAPQITAVILDKPAYTIGDTAQILPIGLTLGNGGAVTYTYAWLDDDVIVPGETSVTYVVATSGTIKGRATPTSSSGTGTTRTSSASTVAEPRPDAPGATDWGIVAVVGVSGITNRYTAQLRFSPTGNIDEDDITAVQWSYNGFEWYDTTEVGTWDDGQRLFEMAPPSGLPSYHTVGFSDETAVEPGGTSGSKSIVIRISTAGGTSAQSASKTFTGPPPPPAGITLVEPADNDWGITEVIAAPSLSERYTGVITFEPDGANEFDDTDFVGVQWSGDGGIWSDTLESSTDGSGRRRWIMLPTTLGGFQHAVGYSQSKSILVRVLTEDGQSKPSVSAKTFTGPAAPTPEPGQLTPGVQVTVGGDTMTLGGLPVTMAPNTRPANIDNSIDVSIDSLGRVVITPQFLPGDASYFRLSYAGKFYIGSRFRVAPVEGFDRATLRAYSASGVGGVSRRIRIPDA